MICSDMIVVNAFIKKSVNRNGCTAWHMRSQGGTKGAIAPKQFLENYVILSFEKRFSKQNSVICLKSNILAPPKFLVWLRHCSLATVALNEVVHRK